MRVLATLTWLVVAGLIAGCASGGRPVPDPFPRAGGRSTPIDSARASLVDGDAVARTALDLLGTPYQFGGGDRSGLDCSGLVQLAYRQHGVALPREVAAQYRVGVSLDPRRVRPGDLLFFSTVARGVSHVAISLGGQRFIHAPSTGGRVRIEDLRVDYWARRLIGARRIGAD